MANPELIESWRTTTHHLEAALAVIPADCATNSEADLREYRHYLEHNELELAFDALERAIMSCPEMPIDALDNLAYAATNMALRDRASALAEMIAGRRS